VGPKGIATMLPQLTPTPPQQKGVPTDLPLCLVLEIDMV